MQSADVINYLESHYLTRAEFARQAKVSEDRLLELIKMACVPLHSHKLTHQTRFHTEIFSETVMQENEVFYYHPSLVPWAIEAEKYAKKAPLTEVADIMRNNFKNEFYKQLGEVQGASQLFHQCFSGKGDLNKVEAEKLFNMEWPYVMNGTYGVCLKEISAKNIITKAVCVAQLEKFINSGLANVDKVGVNKVLQWYDHVASNFGPHEVAKSTRGRLFNKLNELLAL